MKAWNEWLKSTADVARHYASELEQKVQQAVDAQGQPESKGVLDELVAWLDSHKGMINLCLSVLGYIPHVADVVARVKQLLAALEDAIAGKEVDMAELAPAPAPKVKIAAVKKKPAKKPSTARA